MTVASLLARYGYAAVLVGAFLEGETIVIMGGFAARRGYLDLPGVIALAFVGSFVGDQLAYFVGRRFGERLLARRPGLRRGVQRVYEAFALRGTWLLVGFRFLYGLRNLVPFTLGLSGIPPRRFVPWNALGAALWAPIMGVAGYLFGRAFEALVSRARVYEQAVLALLVVAGVALLLVRRGRARRLERDG